LVSCGRTIESDWSKILTWFSIEGATKALEGAPSNLRSLQFGQVSTGILIAVDAAPCITSSIPATSFSS
jgi:hypothetical protein